VNRVGVRPERVLIPEETHDGVGHLLVGKAVAKGAIRVNAREIDAAILLWRFREANAIRRGRGQQQQRPFGRRHIGALLLELPGQFAGRVAGAAADDRQRRRSALQQRLHPIARLPVAGELVPAEYKPSVLVGPG